MPRILNVQIPDKKRVEIGLTFIKGIGKSRSNKICSILNLDKNLKIGELTRVQLSNLISFIQKTYKTGNKLDNERINNIKTQIKISSYKGFRHFKGLPLNGQRTCSNSKTVRRLRKSY